MEVPHLYKLSVKISITICLSLFLNLLYAQPNTPQHYKNMGWFKARSGDYEEAIKLFTKAIALDSTYADAYNNRGNARMALSQYKEALLDFDTAITLNPSDPLYYYNRALTKIKMKKLRSAIEDYNLITNITKEDPEVYIKRASILVELHEYDAAVKDYDAAIIIEPVRAEYYYLRALAKMKSETFLDGHIDLIQAAHFDYPAAKQMLLEELLIQIPQDTIVSLTLRASYKIASQDYKSAISDLDQVLSVDTKAGRAYYLRGVAYVALEKTTKACKDFEQATMLNISDALEPYNRLCK